MFASTLTSKGHLTIPSEVRDALGLKPGDKISFELSGHKAIMTKIEPFDAAYHLVLSNTLSEWSSPEDDEAYNEF